MSFCFLYNVVLENHSVQNSPWGGGGSIASSRSNRYGPANVTRLLSCVQSSFKDSYERRFPIAANSV